MRLIGLLALGAILVPVLPAGAISERDQWQATYRFAGPAELVIENVWGDVEVRGVGGDAITVSVSEHRSARDATELARSRELIRLDVVESDTGIRFRVDGVLRDWRGRHPCPSCRVEYRFVVEAPRATRVVVSTVNDGKVRIEDIDGPVRAANVNGPVTALAIARCENLSTVNGDIRAEFATAPGADCGLETINGDIVTVLPAGAGIDLELKLGHGTVYSEFEVTELALPPRVERTERRGSSSYRIEQPAGLRVGAGGAAFSFASMNGDVYVRRAGVESENAIESVK